MTTYEKVVSSTIGERELGIEQLTKIDGIARKTAEAVYEIGVHSYADLAQYSSQHTAQQISAALREHGVKRPPTFIDPTTWARQARAFGELENAAPAPSVEARTSPAKPQEAPSSHDSPAHDAEFTVFFDMKADDGRESTVRTTVFDRANGTQERVFQGNDTGPWVSWMLERANLPVTMQRVTEQAEISSLLVPAELSDARIEICDVELSVLWPTTDHPKKRLEATVSFCLSGSDAETLVSREIPFRIEGYTVDLESGVSEQVTFEQSQLEPEVFEYVGRQAFAIPGLGRYEFCSIVLLLPPAMTAIYYRGPTIEIVL
jgi:hypothetical protein